MKLHIPKWLIDDDPDPKYSRLDTLDGLPGKWFAQCTGEGHLPPHAPSTIHGPFDTEDAAAHAHHWHEDCTIRTFQKEES